MGLFSSSKKAPAPAQTPADTDIAQVTQDLYKQNVEIVVKNKTLSLLGKLYEISILTLSPKELSEQLTKSIQDALGYEFVGIFLYDQTKDELAPLSASMSERIGAVQIAGQPSLASVVIPNVSKTPFFTGVVTKRSLKTTEQLSDVWDSLVSKEVFQNIQTSGHIRSTVVTPMTIGSRFTGALIISLNRPYDELASYEKDSVRSFTNVIAVALDKALIYEQLKAANVSLEQSNVRQESLLNFISHEIKGYLTKNRNAFIGIAEGDYGVVAEETKALASEAFKDTTKGVDTIMQILDASNLKKGTVQYTMKPFDLKPLVAEITNDLTSSAQSKGLTLKLEIDEKNTYTITGDKDQISKHVVRNLVDNSIKYTPTGSVTVGLTKKDGKVLFYTKDTGIGVTAEDRERLFTEGGRGKDSTKVNVNSTGFGLYIAKSIVLTHGGRIWEESEGRGKGSQFYVEFPVGK